MLAGVNSVDGMCLSESVTEAAPLGLIVWRIEGVEDEAAEVEVPPMN